MFVMTLLFVITNGALILFICAKTHRHQTLMTWSRPMHIIMHARLIVCVDMNSMKKIHIEKTAEDIALHARKTEGETNDGHFDAWLH